MFGRTTLPERRLTSAEIYNLKDDQLKKITDGKSSSSSVSENTSINGSLPINLSLASYRNSKILMKQSESPKINPQLFDDTALQKAIDSLLTKARAASNFQSLHNDLPQQYIERKRKQFDSIDDDSINKRFLITQSKDSNELGQCNADTDGTVIKTEKIKIADGMAGVHALQKDVQLNSQLSQNISMEWTQLDQLVTILCQNELNHLQPMSETLIQLKKEILIQVSITPDPIRFNSIIADNCSEAKLEQFINECKTILFNIRRANSEAQWHFSASRDRMIATLKSPNDCLVLSNLNIVESKVKTIIEPLLYPETLDQELVTQLIKNPHALEDYELVNKRISNESVNDIMREIKSILDSVIQVREAETFNFPKYQHFDVPFVVNLNNKFGEMTKDYARELINALNEQIENLNCQPKPKFIESKTDERSMKIVCANRMSFDWLKKNISKCLDIAIHPVKRLSKNKRKTILLKFKEPTFLHFNNLMEELNKNNPRLLTQRWELRNNGYIESTKCIHVGVDIESLLILEDMNRVVILGKSFVFFDINYEEESFELYNFSKANRKRNKMRN